MTSEYNLTGCVEEGALLVWATIAVAARTPFDMALTKVRT